MAPDEPNQKGKRGRAAVASTNADTASDRESQEVVHHDSSSSTVIRRRRPRKGDESVGEEQAPPPAKNQPSAIAQSPDTAPKRTGRPGKKNQDAAADEVRLPEKQSNETAQPVDMAPKKRGRPPRNQETEPGEVESINKQSNETAQSPELATKKRGRPAKNQDPEPEEVEPAETRPRKRTRGNVEAEAVKSQEVDPNSRTKTGKRSNASKEAHVSESQEATEGVSQPRRRGRPANVEEPIEEAQDGASKQGGASKKKAGRPPRQPELDRQSADENASSASQTEKSTENGNSAQTRPKKSKRGRPSLAEVPISKAQNKSVPPPEEDITDTNTQTKKKRGPGRPSPETTTNSPSASFQPPQQKERPKDPPHYPVLTTLTRSIPRSTISSKWAPLPATSISQVQSLISDSARPVLLRLRESTSRQEHASTILRIFSNRLNTKLAKGMPFPPSAGGGQAQASLDEQLDFEKTLDAIQALEKQLDPLLHSVALLKVEKEKEESKLEAEYKALKELEDNARAQRGGWREKLGKGRRHQLVPLERNDDDEDEVMERLGEEERMGLKVEVIKRDNSKANFGAVFFKAANHDENDEEGGDEDIELLAKQIASHMESMKGNLGQIDGLAGEIGKGKAALQGVLGKYLGEEAYESVVLG
ncbi:CENP-Q, a CENPA-CAD centromere complex subunit-domain-containing protein [Cladorrhinum sp. PSN259]|nr:CENP-Q, a CENPA-CAD centromere complex subunit-domain-containing protein [Cladorrhinum sp. PSN259]